MAASLARPGRDNVTIATVVSDAALFRDRAEALLAKHAAAFEKLCAAQYFCEVVVSAGLGAGLGCARACVMLGMSWPCAVCMLCFCSYSPLPAHADAPRLASHPCNPFPLSLCPSPQDRASYGLIDCMENYATLHGATLVVMGSNSLTSGVTSSSVAASLSVNPSAGGAGGSGGAGGASGAAAGGGSSGGSAAARAQPAAAAAAANAASLIHIVGSVTLALLRRMPVPLLLVTRSSHSNAAAAATAATAEKEGRRRPLKMMAVLEGQAKGLVDYLAGKVGWSCVTSTVPFNNAPWPALPKHACSAIQRLCSSVSCVCSDRLCPAHPSILASHPWHCHLCTQLIHNTGGDQLFLSYIRTTANLTRQQQANVKALVSRYLHQVASEWAAKALAAVLRGPWLAWCPGGGCALMSDSTSARGTRLPQAQCPALCLNAKSCLADFSLPRLLAPSSPRPLHPCTPPQPKACAPPRRCCWTHPWTARWRAPCPSTASTSWRCRPARATARCRRRWWPHCAAPAAPCCGTATPPAAR